jgi:carbamoyltransferase
MGLAPFGVPRIPVSNFYHIIDDRFEFQDVLRERFSHNERWPNRSAEYMDLAASVQLALENAVLHICKKLKVRTASDVLCYAGGVALNSVANERIVNEAGFENVFIMPASEDSGTAIGAAFYGLWQLDGYSKQPQQRIDSVGHVYPPEEIDAALRCFPEVKIIKSDDILGSVCELLSQGKIVGWYDSGSELGPRALGQRSILSDPRSASAKEFINRKIKFREEFRPFAPMITEEDVHDWFEVTDRHCTSPFMLRVLRFRAEKAHQVAAVVHVDGTGRVQTVSKSFSPMLHALLTQWKARTGIPILLNTSFNIAGDPIVETPRDALLCLCYTGLDCCRIGRQIVTKDYEHQPLSDCVTVLNTLWYGLFGLDGNPVTPSIIPSVEDISDNVMSVHISRISELALNSVHLRLATRNPWGDVVHGISAGFIRILDLIDGHSTIYRIFCALSADSTLLDPNNYSMTCFMRQLAVLRRLGAIDFVQTSGPQSESSEPAKTSQQL